MRPETVFRYYFLEEAHYDPMIKSLDYLAKAVSKLSMKEADPWQIVNYGVGGQYEPHTDHKVAHHRLFSSKLKMSIG